VHGKKRRKLDDKGFRGVMVGYPLDAPRNRVYNFVTRRITNTVHVAFKEDVPWFGVSTTIDSMIIDAFDVDGDHGHVPLSHPLDLDSHDADDLIALPNVARIPRLWSHPIRYGDLVAHLSDHPRVFVTACCDREQGK
jgi:hypothetical protein